MARVARGPGERLVLISLRITLAGATRSVELAGSEWSVGSSPLADLALPDSGLAPVAGFLRLEGRDLVFVPTADSAGALRVAPGTPLMVGAVEFRHAARAAPAVPPPSFGGYDEAPGMRGPAGPAQARGATMRADAATGGSAFALAPELPPAPPVAIAAGTTPAFRRPSPPPPSPPPPTNPALDVLAKWRDVWRRRVAGTALALPPTKSASPPPTGRNPPPASDAEAARTQPNRPAVETAPQKDALPKPATPTRPGARSASFAQPSVGTALLDSIRRSPFYFFSASIHGLVFFILLLLVETTADPPTPHGLGSVNASISTEEDIGEISEEEPTTFELLEDMPEAGDLMPTLQEENLAPPPPDQAELDPWAILEELRDREETLPTEVGILPNADVFRRRAPTRPKKQAAEPALAPKELNASFSGGVSSLANQRAAQIVREMLGKGRSGTGATLDDISGDDILVITGGFDRIGLVLEALSLPFKQASPYELRGDKVNFEKHKVIFWNCGDALPPEFARAVAGRLERFVKSGGYLFTTDWAVAHVLNLAFPGVLVTKGKSNLPEAIVDIRPAANQLDHPLLEGVFIRGTEGRWWLEQLAFDVRAGSTSHEVETLIESSMLRNLYGASPIVALTFAHGRGRVLHTVGHYYQEAGNVAGAIAVHRLALNFVLMRIERDLPKK